jgi:serine phosphatase RsbU (regulator of sigma subunit)/anti-sigma regulatory factor (Ser/Thr protein kinase)
MAPGAFDAVCGTSPEVVRRVRAFLEARLQQLSLEHLADDALLVASELATNAVLHGGGVVEVEVRPVNGGVRMEIRDRSRVAPVLPAASEQSMTGRGLRLVEAVATKWGVDPRTGGKTVWAEIHESAEVAEMPSVEDLLAMWDDDLEATEIRYDIELGAVPTDLLVAAKTHVDNLVREFVLAAGGATSGLTEPIPAHLANLIESVVNRFADARVAIKRQAIEAASRGDSHVDLRLRLSADAADAGEEYLAAIDEADSYCRAARLLTLESPPQHRLFRHWYVDELVAQLRARSAGEVPPPVESFEHRMLRELDQVAVARRAAERVARLYDVSAALSRALTPEAVAQAVLTEGMAALGASGGGLLVQSAADRLLVPGTVGYDEAVVNKLRTESPDAELPAAVALRTGQPVWLESAEERDRRFPELIGMEQSTISMCAVPLIVGATRLGAMRFSFNEPRLFDDDERRFVQSLAAQAAQALERAQLYANRVDTSHRLQQSLLPPTLPTVDGLDIAAVYHPFGQAMEVGGDFYDMWKLEGNRWALAIGDASGTGPEAAALTAITRYTTRALTMTDSRPEQVLTCLNRALLDAGAAGADGERFCTALFGVVEPTADGVAIELAGGGHPDPIVRSADGSVRTVEVRGSMLGLFPDAEVRTARILLGPGDALVVYTDGASEARRDGEMFGLDGLMREIAEVDLVSAQAIATHIEDVVVAYSGGAIRDDLALFVLVAR